MAIHPVILCGGSGSRLWPLSRQQRPKQFLPLAGPRSLLQDTVARVGGPAFAPPLLVAAEDHRFIVAEQMRAAGCVPAAILLEPAARGTAPAVGLAALWVAAREPGAMLLILPSDHVIADTPAFLAALETAVPAAVSGELVTFGVTPQGPETGYGYIRAGAAHPSVAGCVQVDRFVEKPDHATAEAWLAEGGYFWNSGIYLFRADALIGELERLRPDIVAALRNALAGAVESDDFLRPEAASFMACPAAAIDTAVMERTAKAVMVPVSMGWSDVGGWAALWALAPKDDAGNAVQGDAVLVGSTNCYVHGQGGGVTALVGVEDLVVVTTGDATLVARRDHAQEVKEVVARLDTPGCALSSRPLEEGEGFRVRHLTIAPGAAIGPHVHLHRAEHWVVVDGTARLTRGDEGLLLAANQSAWVPAGQAHLLENPGVVPLRVIEVQSGAYLGDDDVEDAQEGFAAYSLYQS